MSRKAILTIDMIDDFVYGSLPVGKPAADLVPYIVEQIDKAIVNDDIVVFAVDDHNEDDDDFKTGKWPKHAIRGTEGQELFGDLKEWFARHQYHPNVIYVPKTKYNAFYGTNLAKKLKTLNVTYVEAMGVCTDICVFITLNAADEYGFKTAVHKRGVATFTENGQLFLDHAYACFRTEVIE